MNSIQSQKSKSKVTESETLKWYGIVGFNVPLDTL